MEGLASLGYRLEISLVILWPTIIFNASMVAHSWRHFSSLRWCDFVMMLSNFLLCPITGVSFNDGWFPHSGRFAPVWWTDPAQVSVRCYGCGAVEVYVPLYLI
eukprot:Gb_25043 [translate_table: standard]